MDNGVSLIKKINRLGINEEILPIYKGILRGLKDYEIEEIFDYSFNENLSYLFEKIKADLEWKKNANYTILFDKLLAVISDLKDYKKNQTCACFLTLIAFHIDSIRRKKLISYLLGSTYRNNLKRAYHLIEEFWELSFSTEIINSWNKFKHPDLIPILINHLSEIELDKISISIYNEMKEVSDYDFNIKKLRNFLLIKKSDKFKKQINKLKKNDPISYIYIQKQLGNKIEQKYLIKAYKNHERFLPGWLAEMGEWEIINSLIEKIK